MMRTEPIDARDLQGMPWQDLLALLETIPFRARRNVRRMHASANRRPPALPWRAGTREHSTHCAYMDADAFL